MQVKSVRTPNGTMQSHGGVPTASPKCRDAGRSPPKSSSTKGKMGKLPQPRTGLGSANTKQPSTKKPSSPVTYEERLNAASLHVSRDKENGKLANGFETKSGHNNSYACNIERGHLDEKLEPGSSIPSTFNCTSRNPLVAMNPIPVTDSLDQSQGTDFPEN